MTGSAPRRDRRRAARLALFAALGAVLAVEVGLRAVDVPAVRRFRNHLDPLAAEVRRTGLGPHPYLGYARELDARPDPGALRVACLGGCPPPEIGGAAAAWPARLEHHLRAALPDRPVQVLDATTRGYSSFESLIDLALRVSDFRPHAVVVHHGREDVESALHPGVARDNSHRRAVWRGHVPTLFDRLLGWSWTYRIARRYATDHVEERGSLESRVVRPAEGAPAEGAPAHGDPARGLASFERNLRDVVALARGGGATVALVAPAADLSELPPLRVGAMRAFREAAREVAATEGIVFVDAAPLPAGAVDGATLTAEGADLLAREIASALAASGVADG